MAIKRVLLWLTFAALALGIPGVALYLPANPSAVLRAERESWAGVLRVWLAGGWEPGYGSFTPWLNERARRFEKRNPGVYLQFIGVSSDIIADFAASENPPDMLLFAPGMLSGAQNLLAIDTPSALRADLRASGGECAAPVAMGGYAWAYNRSYLKEIPADWRELGAVPQTKNRARKPALAHWLHAPADQPFTRWTKGLRSLMAERVEYVSEGSGAPPVPALDLGLPEAAATEPPLIARIVPCHPPDDLPEDFQKVESVFAAFTRGTAAAVPVTQREIRRLQIYAETGKAPDWAVSYTGDGYTDQLLFLAVVDWPREDIEARQALCGRFLEFLLTEDSQKALTAIRALPVIETEPLYARQAGMAQLEEGYRQAALQTEPLYGTLAVP